MTKRIVDSFSFIIIALVLSGGAAQAQTREAATTTPGADTAGQSGSSFFELLAKERPAFSLVSGRNSATARRDSKVSPMGLNLQVLGGGTLGRMTKWTGFNSINSVIGDSTIFEDKKGLVGIGTDSPTAKLTVAGTIQITQGGLKFSDGTVLTSGQIGVPLILQGPVFRNNPFDAVIEATNTANGGLGILARGGAGNGLFGGDAILALAGPSDAGGGTGVAAQGGDSTAAAAGVGVVGAGGNNFASGNGGFGAQFVGGVGSGAGKSGGTGLFAALGSGINGATNGLAGSFIGDVQVMGNLSKSGGSFKIDHPLDPENKYLYHSFVESPDMMNIYNGNITTDQNGEAVVALPDWFEALNRDFRYQLTVVGQFAQAIVAEKVKGNRFIIRTSAPGVEVSWQVTGIRQDAYANAHRIPVEVDKPEAERSSYLNPDAFNQPEDWRFRYCPCL